LSADSISQNHCAEVLALFTLLVDVLDQLTTVSGLVAKEVSKPTHAGFRQGAAWNEWVCLLTLIMKEHGLPFEARKDVDKKATSKVSPFVRFVAELQRQLPEEFHQFTHSLDALSQAISRARQGLDLNRTFFGSVRVNPGAWPQFDELKRRYGDNARG
jgi:hypothetical protein